MSTIRDRYDELVVAGWGPAVPLPVVPLPVPGTDGWFFSYVLTSGVTVTIYEHPETGAYEVHGAILGHYLQNGGPLWLGFPISDEEDNVVGNQVLGRVSHFSGGSIFYSFATGMVSEITVQPSPAVGFEIFDGIDVSYAQGSIDWTKVANSGIHFAYIKATEGDTTTDPRFAANWSSSSGLVQRGAYHYFHARRRPEDARVQANHFVDVINQTGLNTDLPPVADVESLPSGVTVDQAIASLQFFLAIVAQSTGWQPIIYTYPSFWKDTMRGSSAFSPAYKLWIASYGRSLGGGAYATRMNGPLVPPGWNAGWHIWQHAINKEVGGIQTLVDRDTVIVPDNYSLYDYLTM